MRRNGTMQIATAMDLNTGRSLRAAKKNTQMRADLVVIDATLSGDHEI